MVTPDTAGIEYVYRLVDTLLNTSPFVPKATWAAPQTITVPLMLPNTGVVPTESERGALTPQVVTERTDTVPETEPLIETLMLEVLPPETIVIPVGTVHW